MDMKKILLLAAAAFMAVLSLQAQRMGCLHSSAVTRASEGDMLPSPVFFDPQKTYRQAVVLVSFNDRDFSMADPKDYYHRLFNEQGFNMGAGPGCVADYFREQSGGRANLQFDIYGPVKVDKTAGGHGANYYGYDVLSNAISLLCDSETSDFSVYDWNGDGRVNQVLFVAAGYSGDQVSGYIYPSTQAYLSKLPNGITVYFTSITCELWKDGSLSGWATIAHEFSHCLGLPDIYPLLSASPFSTVDEWDLMDGGNYTNSGWCPPNFSAMEKMFLKWDTPEELTQPTTITGMKPVSAGGKSYIVRNPANADEFYLLENRQQEGWDYACPGHGLLIFHVDFDEEEWRLNYVNISDSHFRYDLFHADGKSYIDWDPDNNGKDPNKYTMPGRMRSSYLSTSPYPFTDPVTLAVNNSLTDESSPAATLFTPATDGRLFLGKAITNIVEAEDGTISFDFMKEIDTGIQTIDHSPLTIDHSADAWYDLSGHKVANGQLKKGLYLRRSASGAFQKILVP